MTRAKRHRGYLQSSSEKNSKVGWRDPKISDNGKTIGKPVYYRFSLVFTAIGSVGTEHRLGSAGLNNPPRGCFVEMVRPLSTEI